MYYGHVEYSLPNKCNIAHAWSHDLEVDSIIAHDSESRTHWHVRTIKKRHGCERSLGIDNTVRAEVQEGGLLVAGKR